METVQFLRKKQNSGSVQQHKLHWRLNLPTLFLYLKYFELPKDTVFQVAFCYK